MAVGLDLDQYQLKSSRNGPSVAEQRPVSHEGSERAIFGVEEDDFGLRLLNLDGTEILRSSEPLSAEDLLEREGGVRCARSTMGNVEISRRSCRF